MTLPQAKRLLARQAGKISLRGLEKVFLARRVNSRLAETILLNSSDPAVLLKIRDFFVERVIAKDKRALNVLLRASDEGLNKNSESRFRAVNGLWSLAQRGESGVLPGLLKAVKDSDETVRWHAAGGLLTLALKGEVGVLPGLLSAVNDSKSGVRLHAVSGLRSLAELGDRKAQEKLKQIGETWGEDYDSKAR